ncbi:MAG: signal peptidase I [Clostridia bacterium]|nr:signal peptidase I [Clostridia bacterium]
MNENNINTDAVTENAEEEKRTPQQAVYDWIEIVAVSLSVVLLFLTFIARVTTVVGDSMLPTLHDGESLLVIGIGYTPKSGDIVVVQDDRSEINYPIVKRVIGTENDVIEFDFDNWAVYVNGEKLDEDYINKKDFVNMKSYGCDDRVKVPEGCVFVMGDNRNGSTDSRDSRLGFVSVDDVIGKVALRLSPLDKFGAVD